jgi:aspartate/methionine/tyrosine aminotransferase
MMAVIIAPYYFSHKLALQLCDAKVTICPFERTTLYPDWEALQNIITEQKPKMVNAATMTIITL